jgi:hypothetical protein
LASVGEEALFLDEELIDHIRDRGEGNDPANEHLHVCPFLDALDIPGGDGNRDRDRYLLRRRSTRRVIIHTMNRASATQNNHLTTKPRPNTTMMMIMNRISAKLIVPPPHCRLESSREHYLVFRLDSGNPLMKRSSEKGLFQLAR